MLKLAVQSLNGGTGKTSFGLMLAKQMAQEGKKGLHHRLRFPVRWFAGDDEARQGAHATAREIPRQRKTPDVA